MKSLVLLISLLTLWAPKCQAASAGPLDPKQLVEQAVSTELAADKADHSHWMYRDFKKSSGKSLIKLVIQTPDGEIYKTLEINGKPLTPEQQAQDTQRMNAFAADPKAQAKQRSNSRHDDEQASALTKLLPDAFIWTAVDEATPGEITLSFRPNPHFDPPSREAKVFAAMTGTMILDEQQHRIKKLAGRLAQPVRFGGGFFGKLEKGGTFQIERSQIAPGEWQITETHVHINGHALFFKTISEQEDESSSEYKPVQPMSMKEAAGLLSKESAP